MSLMDLVSTIMKSLVRPSEKLSSAVVPPPVVPSASAPAPAPLIIHLTPSISKKMNDAGLSLLKEFEGCRLKAYPDPATGGAPWTIGFGHTGPDVTPTAVWTADQALGMLRKDLDSREQQVNTLPFPLTSNQFSALVSFTYNCGFGNTKKLAAEGKDRIADKLLDFDRAAGKVMAGLTRRRKAERELFLQPDGDK